MQMGLLETLLLPADSLRIMVAMMRQLSLDPGRLIDLAGGDHAMVEQEPDQSLNGSIELRLQIAFAQATGANPDTWWRAGLEYHPIAYGPLGLAMLSSPTLIDGLTTLTRHQALTYSMLDYRLEQDDDGHYSLVADDNNAPAGLRPFLNMRALGSVAVLMRHLRQGSGAFVQVDSVMTPPSDWRACEDAVGAPIRFGADRTRWILNDDTPRFPLPMASATLNARYQGKCESVIAKARSGDSFTAALAAALEGWTGAPPTAGEIATRMALSDRTLHRRLAARGMSYAGAIEGMQERRARALLSQSDDSIESIAQTLGYSEASSFSRAFSRWTGNSPARYRRMAIAR